MIPFQIPARLLEQRELGPEWVRWLDGLSRDVSETVEQWGLSYDEEALARDGVGQGFCSVVVPVLDPDRGPAALKVEIPDEESEHEALLLDHWAGRGAVRLWRADLHRRALLMERLHRCDLRSVGDDEACEIVAALYPLVHIPALPQIRPITDFVARWLDALATLPVDGPLPRRLVEQTLTVGRDLVDDVGPGRTVVHGDLHHENVLAADREPWLVIDPKGMNGEPEYEPAPMLWNRWEEIVATGDVRSAVRRRFHLLVDGAGLDEERARDWVVVRMILNAHWSIEDAARVGRGLNTEDREWLTQCVAIAKAVQD
ncbi:MAG TPA: aminoglycoside phosphotransferase family protein [Nocardioidaceae bacterium]|nr:aminoglycoside phosphotransferase family protein [Nocardioidaceae bacterium]